MKYKTKLNGLILALCIASLGLQSCEKERRESPYRPNYFIGNWSYEEIIYNRGGAGPLAYTDIEGSIRFRSGLSSQLNWKGSFEVTYRIPGEDTLRTYADDFKWRVDGTSLVISLENEETEYPALGMGIGNLAYYTINTARFKENNIELTTNLDGTFTGIGGSIYLQRK